MTFVVGFLVVSAAGAIALLAERLFSDDGSGE
jgi:hypothetical protein